MNELAKAIVADNVNKTIEKLGSAAYQKIMFLKNLGIHIKRLRDDESSIASELHKFDPVEVGSDAQGPRIKRLRRIHDEIVYFFDEQAAKAKQKEVMGSSKIATELRLFFSTSNQLVSTFKIAGQVNAIMKELNSIDALYSSIASDSSGNQNRCTSSEDTSPFPDTNVLIGRDTDKENVVNMLCNSNDQVSHPVVAIVGVGGQGKTTLAQYVCQDDRVKASFHQRLWVYVTPQSSLKEIFEKIIISATNKKPIYYVLEELHQQVLQAIVGKKCLLVLDNVYYVDNLGVNVEALNTILKYGGFWGNGGKILITTRSKKAAALMGKPVPYELRDLAEDDCWTLLRYYAIKQEEEEKKECGLKEIGKDIVKMCPKVPLVLKIIGCNLAFKDKSDWECFKNQLDSDPTSYMSTQQDKIKLILRHCYDLLDNNLKRCAAFCSLFPKGHMYNKNYMVRNWISLGFVESRDGISLEDVGDAYVLELTQRAFFEGAGDFKVFKMHDVMHDLMRLIGKDTHQMIDSKTKNIVEGVRHVSLSMQDLNWEVLLSSISGEKTLQSILLVSSAWEHRVHGVPLGSGIDRLIPACQKVRVLEIYEQGIVKVPRSIGGLTLIRHLNLSRNPLCDLPNEITKMVNLLKLDLSCCMLKKLPKEMGNLVDLLSLDLSLCINLQELPREMGKLVNLLSLNLSHCMSLEELPRDIGKLVKLRHLWVEGCNLRCMPKGIGNLTELETLDEFVVGKNSRSSRGSKAKAQAKMEDLGHLNNLKGRLRIKLVGRSKYIVSEVGEAHLEKKTKLTDLEIVFEKKAEEDEKFLEGIKLRGENWEKLSIMNYGGKRLPMWMTDDQFHRRFPELDHLAVLRTKKKIPMSAFDCFYMDDVDCGVRFIVEGNEDDLVEWVPRFSRIKEQLKMGNIELCFTTRRSDELRLTDDRDITLHNVYLGIKNELAPQCGSGGQRQPDLLLKCCIPNLTELELKDIPELEVLPEEFRDLSFLESLTINCCKKLKAIPDWIDSLSSLESLSIYNAPELKALPDSIRSLTSLRELSLLACPRMDLQPHQISSLHEYCKLSIM